MNEYAMSLARIPPIEVRNDPIDDADTQGSSYNRVTNEMKKACVFGEPSPDLGVTLHGDQPVPHAPRRPELGLVSQDLGTTFQTLLDAAPVVGIQARSAPWPRGSLQGFLTSPFQPLRPAANRLAMDPDRTDDLGLVDAMG